MPDFFKSVIDILLKFGKLNPVEFYPKRTSATDKETANIQKIHLNLHRRKKLSVPAGHFVVYSQENGRFRRISISDISEVTYDNLFVIIAFAIWEDARATDLLFALVNEGARHEYFELSDRIN